MWDSKKDAEYKCTFNWGSIGKGILVWGEQLGQKQVH